MFRIVPRRCAAPLLAGLLASLVLASSASAAACPAATSQPFARWLDFSYYALVPGGSFEAGGPSWSLEGASVVAGNESFDASGPGVRSLSVPSGASATSPSFCGGLDRPSVRLFAKGGGLLGLLNVTVLYTDGGVLRSQPLGLVTASGAWRPSLPLLTLSGLPVLTGKELAVRVTAIGGSFTIDDVFVDPWGRH